MKLRLITIITALLAITLSACSSLTPEQKLLRDQARAKAVIEKLRSRDFKVMADRMLPAAGSPVTLTSVYFLEVKGDTVRSHLPFSGENHGGMYGGGKGLVFTTMMKSYVTSQIKDDMIVAKIIAPNEEDSYEFYLEVWNNGRTTLTVNANNKSSVSFEGRMDGIK